MTDIMSGSYGPYVTDASHASGSTRQNVGSACLITLNAPHEAVVSQLFTHPLYRARGLATTEVAMGMNKLAKLGVRTLTAWVPDNNQVALRLFAKLGFKQGRKSIEFSTKIGS